MNKRYAFLLIIITLILVSCFGRQIASSELNQQMSESQIALFTQTLTPVSTLVTLESNKSVTESKTALPTHTPTATLTPAPILLDPSERITVDTVNDLALLHTFQLDTRYIKSVSFSKDGSLLGAALADGEYKLWDVRTLQELDTSLSVDNGSEALFSRSGDQMLVTGNAIEETHVWELISGELLYTLPGIWASETALSNDGNILVTLSYDHRNIILSDLSNNGATQIIYGDWRPMDPYADFYPVPLDVFFSPDDSLLVAAMSSRETIIWDLDTEERIAEFNDKSALAISPDGKVMAARLKDGNIALFNTSTWGELKYLNDSFAKQRLPAIFSQDGKLLFAIVADLTINIWDCDTGTKLGTLPTFSGNLILSPDGTLLATYHIYGGEINLWGVP